MSSNDEYASELMRVLGRFVGTYGSTESEIKPVIDKDWLYLQAHHALGWNVSTKHLLSNPNGDVFPLTGSTKCDTPVPPHVETAKPLDIKAVWIEQRFRCTYSPQYIINVREYIDRQIHDVPNGLSENGWASAVITLVEYLTPHYEIFTHGNVDKLASVLQAYVFAAHELDKDSNGISSAGRTAAAATLLASPFRKERLVVPSKAEHIPDALDLLDPLLSAYVRAAKGDARKLEVQLDCDFD